MRRWPPANGFGRFWCWNRRASLASMKRPPWRRPTAHRKFDEATAVLAGDALQSLAFEIITDEARTPFDGETRAALALTLARAAGQAGMAGGQMSDLQGSEDFLEVASMKTGALILAALSMGVIMGRAAQGRAEAVAIHQYGVDLGQLFQLADDLLDAEGDAGEVGKATGKDAEAGKANIVTRLGVVEARRQCEELVRSATARLEIFGEQASSLRDAAQFVLHRRR